MPRVQINEEVLLNGWELEEPLKGLYPFYLAVYDGYGALARLGFRTKTKAMAFCAQHPAPRNSKEAGKFTKGL